MSIGWPGSCEPKGFGPNPSRNSARRRSRITGCPWRRTHSIASSRSHSPIVWASDITDVWTTEGWLYLADRLMGALTLQALTIAIRHRTSKAGVLHHSDRGSQYAATPYQELLAMHGMAGSLSRRGNC